MSSKSNKQAQRRTANAKRNPPKTVIVEKIGGKGKYKSRPVVVAAPAAPAPASDYDSIGGKIGAFVGNGLQGLIKRITGFGEYDIHSNTIMNRGGHPPEFITKGGSVEVSHREYVCDITSSTAFQLQAFPLNPGMPGTFPFISQLAVNFEEYEMMGLVFEFNSSSGDSVGTTNTALGTVIAATSYNPLAPLFANKREMESTLFVDSVKPSKSMLHPVECDPALNQFKNLKVRSPLSDPGTDLDLYDMGNFQIATSGMQAASVIGELWVTYHIRLSKPRLVSSTLLPYLHVHNYVDNAPVTCQILGTPFHFDEGALTKYGLRLTTGWVIPDTVQSANINVHMAPGSYCGYYTAMLASGNFSSAVITAPAVDGLTQFSSYETENERSVTCMFFFSVSALGDYVFTPDMNGDGSTANSFAFALFVVNPALAALAAPFTLGEKIISTTVTEESATLATLAAAVHAANPSLDVGLISRILRMNIEK